ncbi:hypothetical protein GOP47_0006060 [Adiantum capillus-veneris]|uniref:Uncharacterized protein n=1 Tax=Adiantum capillus-veneris TaxID=13818 RepID=A0A9D4V278_ADICA|nr:hypothetical protein GOP47_0006060 [Adiantum capillus-veneris]
MFSFPNSASHPEEGLDSEANVSVLIASSFWEQKSCKTVQILKFLGVIDLHMSCCEQQSWKTVQSLAVFSWIYTICLQIINSLVEMETALRRWEEEDD